MHFFHFLKRAAEHAPEEFNTGSADEKLNVMLVVVGVGHMLEVAEFGGIKDADALLALFLICHREKCGLQVRSGRATDYKQGKENE